MKPSKCWPKKKERNGIKEDIGAPVTKNIVATAAFFALRQMAWSILAGWLSPKVDNRHSRDIRGQLSRLPTHTGSWDKHL